jgi:sodium/hydrogen exchanger-like protein 6/7
MAVPHRQGSRSRKAKGKAPKTGHEFERSELLGAASGSNSDSEFGSDIDISDLPPPAPVPRSRSSPMLSAAAGGGGLEGGSSTRQDAAGEEGRSTQQPPLTATAAFRQLFSTEDPSALFRQLDEDFIKPHLLLDGGNGRGGGGPGSGSH